MNDNLQTGQVQAWLTDMDGVLVHENEALPGAVEFIDTLKKAEVPFLVLTNNPIYSPRDLSWRLHASGIDIPEDHIWTSAMATANFVSQQIPHGKAYVVGEAGLTTALHEVGYVLTDRNPDYVIIGETRNYSFDELTTALRLIQGGARFICTNPDYTGPSSDGDLLAAGSVAAMMKSASGFDPYFIGKPNPIFFRTAMQHLGAHSATTAMIGDRMDTDIKAGLEAGVETFLVMTGISTRDSIDKYPFSPSHVVDSIRDLIPYVASGSLPTKDAGRHEDKGTGRITGLPGNKLHHDSDAHAHTSFDAASSPRPPQAPDMHRHRKDK